MKENKMKTLKKVIIPVIMLCLISACPNDITWVTTDVPSTSGDSSSTGNLTDISTTSITESSTTLVESSTTLIESSTSITGSSTTLIESSTSISETGDIPICGNSIVEFPEECDEGKAGTGTAFCTYNCTISFCGDGIVNVLDNEQCDDSNMNDLDSCSSKCQLLRQ